jgi:hypothetical protein
VGIDLALICKTRGIKTLYLIDNWDNLSSKSIMWERPDYVATWGEQSCNHAVEIQGFDRSKVFSIGTPRYENYFKVRHSEIKSPFNFPYILFLGTALPFDEVSVVNYIDKILIKLSEKCQGVKLIYRPHPWRQGRDVVDLGMLRNTVIDPQVATQYLKGNFSSDFQPPLNYYPGLIKNSLVIIGGLTSMLIESAIFYKKYIALVHDDNLNFTNQKNAFLHYEHFRGIEALNNLYLCDDIQTLSTLLPNLIEQPTVEHKSNLDMRRSFFLYSNEESYQVRISKLCNSIMQNNDSR